MCSVCLKCPRRFVWIRKQLVSWDRPPLAMPELATAPRAFVFSGAISVRPMRVSLANAEVEHGTVVFIYKLLKQTQMNIPQSRHRFTLHRSWPMLARCSYYICPAALCGSTPQCDSSSSATGWRVTLMYASRIQVGNMGRLCSWSNWIRSGFRHSANSHKQDFTRCTSSATRYPCPSRRSS